MRILLVTSDPLRLSPFTKALSTHSAAAVSLVATSSTAREAARQTAPHLVVIDSQRLDGDPLQLVADLIAVDAMIQTAVITDLSEEDFHEASEGLGVLMPLPPNPAPEDATRLLETCKAVGVA